MKKLSVILIAVVLFCFSSIPVKAIPLDNPGKVGCQTFAGLDNHIFEVSSNVITMIQIAVPVLLIIFGMIDFTKAIMGQKEDDIKKAQGLFIKRLLAGALVFFVVFIVKFVVNLVAESGSTSEIIACIDWFISGP